MSTAVVADVAWPVAAGLVLGSKSTVVEDMEPAAGAGLELLLAIVCRSRKVTLL